jgi:lsr operon transcriptional repressor
MGSLAGDEIFVRTGLITLDELTEVRAQGAVGDLCGNFYDASGRGCPGPFADRVVGIRLEDLRRAPAVVVCAGGAEKVPAIAGALRGRLVNALVTDEHTAHGVLELEGERGRRRAGARQLQVARRST